MSSIHYRTLPTRGSIRLYFGPMFAGKTSRAIWEATRMSQYNKVLYVNWKGDLRQTAGGEKGKFTSHNPSNVRVTSEVTCLEAKLLSELEVGEFSVVVVDEAHFYQDLQEIVLRWACELHKHVLVFGLDGDSQQRPIGDIFSLIPWARSCEKLLAQCRYCVSEQLSAGQTSFVDSCVAPCTIALKTLEEQYTVGGHETYAPACEYHAGLHRAGAVLPQTPQRADETSL